MTTQQPYAAKKKRIHEAYLTTAVAQSLPAARMFVAEIAKRIDFDTGKPVDSGKPFDVSFFPVVALQSAVRQRFVCVTDGDGNAPPRGATAREMVSAGWRYDGESVEAGPLFVHPEYPDSILSLVTDRDLLHCTNTDFRIIVAPWPPEQDTDRLTEIADRIQTEGR
jgi:hypothetical protein